MTEELSYAGELAAFAHEPRGGPPAERYYTKRWARALRRGARIAGFNWAAFLFDWQWCFWRKLYLLGILVLSAQFVAPLLGELLIHGTGDLDFTLVGVFVSLFLVQLPFGLFANRLYLRQAMWKIDKARIDHPELPERIEFLRAKGGTSWLALVIALTLKLFIWFFPLFLAI